MRRFVRVARPIACGVLLAAALGLGSGCGKRELAPVPPETLVTQQCYFPFFEAAAKGDVTAVKAVLSRRTIEHHEHVVFPEGAVLRGWGDFVQVYEDMQIAKFIRDVRIEGDRAVVVDPVGGKLTCVREGGVWKVELVD